MSNDCKRIKKTFDTMVFYIKGDVFLIQKLTFFHKTSKMDKFVSFFSSFKYYEDTHQITGVSVDLALLVGKSLSLNLPYQIKDPLKNLDSEIVRCELKSYLAIKDLNALSSKVEQKLAL